MNPTKVLLKESKNLSINNNNIVYEKSFISLASSNIIFDLKEATKKYNSIVLVDNPLGINSYSDYENFIVNLLSQIQPFQNIYLYNDLYLSNILNNINKYKYLKGVYIKTFGLCIKEEAKIEKLFNYYINTNKLKSMIPDNIELTVETDSVCENLDGISNTFGSELWLLDFLFQSSIGGVDSVIINTENKNNLYPYNIFKLFSDAKLYSVNYNTKNNINCYAMRDYKNYYIIVINKDITLDKININVSLDTTNMGELHEFSCNQTILGTEGITFNKIKDITQQNGMYNFLAETMKAYVLIVPFSSGGAFFENINNSDEKSTIITVSPNPLTEEYDAVPTTMSVRTFKKELLDNY